MKNSKIIPRGFTLVEMAVVIMLIGILMTFGIKLASSFQDRAAYSVTKDKQSKIEDALRSYLAQNGRLPCPASILSPPTGVEDPLVFNGTCTANPGIVPYVTLGLPRDSAVDGWSRLFLYEVANSQNPACVTSWVINSNFVVAPYRTFHDGENGCISVVDDQNGDGAITADIIRNNIVAVVISNGPNGEGGYSQNGVLSQLSEADTTASRERDNIPAHSGKVMHTFHTEPTILTGFDDIVSELTANDLLAPLKRDGSVKSINGVARDYFNNNISVNPACILSYSPAMTPNPPNAPVLKVSPVTLTVPLNGVNYTQTITGPEYGCPTGFNYP